MGPIKKRRGANLPHWTAGGAAYFVTFRLGDSLPQDVVEAYRAERNGLLAHLRTKSPSLANEDAQRLHDLFTEKIESYLDAGAGACWMRQPVVADLVQNALLFFHGNRYFVQAWSVMPNHVHVVVRPNAPVQLADVLHSWKSYTAKEVNTLVGRTGELWQAESWDHLVRDADDLLRCVEYTARNPEKAGLDGWTWMGRNCQDDRP